VNLLERLVRRDEPVVYAPRFDRGREEAIAGAVGVPQATRLVVVEGNYLLYRGGSWARVRPLLDQVWYLDTPAALRRHRLLDRQQRTYGPDAGADWVARVDEPNAVIVEATRSRADLVVESAPA
jgi:pantothenate kinase